MEKIFAGKTVYVIGTGPSLTSFQDWDKVLGQPAIVLNAAIVQYPGAAVWCSSERRFWRDHAPKLCPHYEGLKCSPHVLGAELRVRCLPAHGINHLDEVPVHGRQFIGSSDYYGLQLAYYLGASKIALLGLDLVPSNTYEAGIFPERLQRLGWLIRRLSERGIDVHSVTKTALEVPYRPLTPPPPPKAMIVKKAKATRTSKPRRARVVSSK